MESVGSIIMYCVIVAAIIVFSILTVTTRRILRAATYLLFVLFATAGIYFKLDYEFPAVQIAVYAGGIVVLFVFSILLTSNPGDSSARLASKRRVMGIIAALLSFVVMGFALCRHEFWTALSRPFTTDLTMQEIGQVLLGTEKWQYLLPFEAVSVLLLACIIGGVVVARKR